MLVHDRSCAISARHARDREHEHEVEEQLERRDALLVRSRRAAVLTERTARRVHGARLGHVQHSPARVGAAGGRSSTSSASSQPTASAASRRTSSAAAGAQSTLAHPRAVALDDEPALEADEREQRGRGAREAPRRRLLAPSGLTSVAPRRGGAVGGRERGVQRRRGARLELGVLVEQQAEAPAGAPQQRRRVLARSSRRLDERDHVGRDRVRARGVGGAVRGGVVEHERLGLEVHRRALAGDRVQAVAQQLPLLRVDDAVGELDVHRARILPARPARRCCSVIRPTRRRAKTGASSRPRGGAHERAGVAEAGLLGDAARGRVVLVREDLDAGRGRARRAPSRRAAASRASRSRGRGRRPPPSSRSRRSRARGRSP